MVLYTPKDDAVKFFLFNYLFRTKNASICSSAHTPKSDTGISFLSLRYRNSLAKF